MATAEDQGRHAGSASALSPEALALADAARVWLELPGGATEAELLLAAASDALGRCAFAACAQLLLRAEDLCAPARALAATGMVRRSLVLWHPESLPAVPGPSELFQRFADAPAPERERASELFRAMERAPAERHGALLLAGVHANFVLQDHALAARLWSRSADAGDAGALCCLAMYHEYGEGGMPLDPERALELYRRAADAGHANARCHVGLCLLYGVGVDASPAEAVRAFAEASDRGIARATRMLAMCYEEGHGVRRDAAEGGRILRQAADCGDPRAMLIIALRAERAGERAEAHSMLREAARLGDDLAASRLGLALARGDSLGLGQDVREAVRMLKGAKTEIALSTLEQMVAK